MKLSPSVKKETGHIALGVGIGDAIMIAVLAVLGRLDYTVFLGAALGSAAAIGNFILMGLAVQKAVEDPDRAKAIVQGSYGKRMLGMVAVMVLGLLGFASMWLAVFADSGVAMLCVLNSIRLLYKKA